MTDIREVLTQMGYSLQDQGREYRTRPIYRESDNNTSLKICKITGRFIDFSAQISGSFEDLVKLSLNLKSVDDAKQLLLSKYAFTKPVIKDEPKIKQVKTFDKSLLIKIQKDHSYWTNRGISIETLNLLEGGVVHEGKMANRYVFPIFDSKRSLVGLSGRTLNNSEIKWKHLGTKAEWKYPLLANYEIIKKTKKVILLESIGDMLSLWECGIKNTIVTFGVDVSNQMLNLLLKIDPAQITISFNNDENNGFVGNSAAQKAKEKLCKYFDYDQIEIKLPKMKDFNDMLKEDRTLIYDWQKS